MSSNDRSEPEPMTPEQRWSAIVFLVIFLALVGAELFRDFHPAKLIVVSVLIFWVPLLALHEAGHAFVAWLIGWPLRKIVIGMGQLLGRFRIGSAAGEIRLFPVEGFVASVPTDLSWPRPKSALIYFAGPGIEMVVAGLVIGYAGSDRILSRSEDYGIIACQSLVLACAVHVVLNFVPHVSYSDSSEKLASDGLGILRSFWMPMSHYAEMGEHRYNADKAVWEKMQGPDG